MDLLAIHKHLEVGSSLSEVSPIVRPSHLGRMRLLERICHVKLSWLGHSSILRWLELIVRSRGEDNVVTSNDANFVFHNLKARFYQVTASASHACLRKLAQF